MSELMNNAGLADIDPRLLEAAFNRARNAPLNSDRDSNAILSAIFAEARRGTRDIHTLVSAASRTGSIAA